MANFFTSDEHYFHQNIIKYCNRPFANVEQMNQALIDAHNEVVNSNDIVYHLGDFTFQPLRKAFSILEQLNGKHILIRGNHDYWLGPSKKHILDAADVYFGGDKLVDDKLVDIQDMIEVGINIGTVIMCHYPMVTWHKSHKGSIMLHGHCHGNIDAHNIQQNVRRFDVGVDVAYKLYGSYRPFSIHDIVELCKTRAEKNLIDIDNNNNTREVDL